MVEKVLEKNKIKFIPIPEKIVKHVGLHAGSSVEITDDGFHIILTPVEEDFSEEEWKKLKDLSKTKGKTYTNPKGVKQYLQKLKK